MVLTKNYLSLDDVILKNKASQYPSDDIILACVAGRNVPDGITQREVRYYPTPADCLNAVEKGEADVTFIPSSFVEELYYRNFYTQVTIVALSLIHISFPPNSLLISALLANACPCAKVVPFISLFPFNCGGRLR